MLRKIFTMSAVLLFATTLAAQPTIEKFIISVWPEYDHPGVLVIFNAQLGEEDIPAEVRFPVPERSRFALVAGSTDTTANRMIPIPIQDAETGKEIQFTAVQPSFHVEFYFNPFPESGAHRHYQYDFTSNLPIDSLLIDLQQPMAAENFSAEVPVDRRMEDSHGLIYHRRQISSLPAGESIHIEAHYDNPSGQMTNNLLQNQMGGSQQMGGTMPPGQGQDGGGTSRNFWILGLVGVLVVGVLFYVSRSGKGPSESTEQPESNGVEKREESSPEGDGTPKGDVKYCIYCGTKLQSSARFCTNCGKEQSESE